ncbi:hypothetical protein pb186bvf_004326 [Paramecium bursaria]
MIIDYGSSTTKAGLSVARNPQLQFRSYVNKFKDNVNMNNMIAQSDQDIFKNFRSPFEKNLLQHIGALETITDYIFTKLNIDQPYPTLLTECFGSTDVARNMLLELMFECYNLPSVMLGVDSLYSLFDQDLSQYLSQNRVVVSFGDQVTHVVPIVNGQVVYKNIKRINVGGLNSFKLFYNTVSIRNSHLKFQFPQMEYWHKQLTCVALDYNKQLQYFKGPPQYYGYRDKISEENLNYIDDVKYVDAITIDIPIIQKVVTQEDIKRKDEMRQRMRIRLLESVQQGNARKKAIQLENLRQLEEEYEKAPSDSLKRKILNIQVKLGMIEKDAIEQLKYNLLNTPDDKLTPSQLNIKRYQRIMFDQAAAKKQKNQEFKKKQEDARKFKLEEPEKYLEVLYEKRDIINNQIKDKKKLQLEIVSRNSRFNQKRIQTLAYLGQDSKDDDFGLDDKDWELYRDINKDGDSEDEKLKYKLQDIEAELKDIDPEFSTKILKSISNIHQLGMELNQVMLSVDRVRCQEIYFQPSMIGVEQQGLIDAIKLAVRDLDKSILKDVYLVGGGCQILNMPERICRDLTSEFDCPINVNVATHTVDGAWIGMRNFANKYPHLVAQFSINKKEYQEYGAIESFKEHAFSNIID